MIAFDIIRAIDIRRQVFLKRSRCTFAIRSALVRRPDRFGRFQNAGIKNANGMVRIRKAYKWGCYSFGRNGTEGRGTGLSLIVRRELYISNWSLKFDSQDGYMDMRRA